MKYLSLIIASIFLANISHTQVTVPIDSQQFAQLQALDVVKSQLEQSSQIATMYEQFFPSPYWAGEQDGYSIALSVVNNEEEKVLITP